jgi:acetyl-CoA carboxylase carboxyltransferase component
MGVVASDCRHIHGGALTADGCGKLKRHLDLCDLLHLPLLNLVDNPGFAVGLEHEIAGTIRNDAEWSRVRTGRGPDPHRYHASQLWGNRQ